MSFENTFQAILSSSNILKSFPRIRRHIEQRVSRRHNSKGKGNKVSHDHDLEFIRSTVIS